MLVEGLGVGGSIGWPARQVVGRGDKAEQGRTRGWVIRLFGHEMIQSGLSGADWAGLMLRMD